MAELSPAAEAVLRAFSMDPYSDRCSLAAALRAAADELAQIPIVVGEPFRGDFTKDMAVVHVADLLAIATELESAQ